MHAVKKETLQQELRRRYDDAKLVWGEHADKQHRIGRGASGDVKNFVSVLQFIKAENILDLGCGNGRNSIYLAEKHEFHIVAAEFVPKAIEILKKKIKDKNLGDKIEPVLLDARKASFAECFVSKPPFDAVMCGEMLDLMTKDEVRAAIAEIWRVLRPGGALLVRVLSDKTRTPIPVKWGGDEVGDEKGTYVSESYDHRFKKEIIRVFHMFSEKELKELFKEFDIKKINLVQSRDGKRYSYTLIAEKKAF